MHVGFIGLGVMGTPMAAHLLDAGHVVCSSVNRTAPAPELLKKGLQVMASPKEVAQTSTVIITMLPNTDDVERVLFGPGSVSEGLGEGGLVIDMSTIDPSATRGFAERFRMTRRQYLDAPVSGGEVGAKAATLSIMCGGPAEAFEMARPLLERLGRNITHVGEVNGSGQSCKIANQIVVALTIEAVGEALVFASGAGCDPAKVREALMGGFAASRVLDVHGERMISRNFEPGFRIALHAKDLDLALAAAAHGGVPLPGTSLCRQLLAANQAAGEWQLDHSAIVKSLERLASNTLNETRKENNADG
ncbi:NAD(P)-dependent oxidoreductase [Rhizobium sp. R693]|uniref:NAD(P)-dependent oxidoreductase n=1 Tax=Rhizobium sp. R693 TaxID=1764276 RepID=UPI000B536F74|nr:NAD(P)-dependent oxidoreductase [Rhizobium sp. R693]OWV98793.1 2-hydroxy-3-oxopropionate reductase [Rhizobium sp. R693]